MLTEYMNTIDSCEYTQTNMLNSWANGSAIRKKTYDRRIEDQVTVSIL